MKECQFRVAFKINQQLLQLIVSGQRSLPHHYHHHIFYCRPHEKVSHLIYTIYTINLSLQSL